MSSYAISVAQRRREIHDRALEAQRGTTTITLAQYKTITALQMLDSRQRAAKLEQELEAARAMEEACLWELASEPLRGATAEPFRGKTPPAEEFSEVERLAAELERAGAREHVEIVAPPEPKPAPKTGRWPSVTGAAKPPSLATFMQANRAAFEELSDGELGTLKRRYADRAAVATTIKDRTLALNTAKLCDLILWERSHPDAAR